MLVSYLCIVICNHSTFGFTDLAKLRDPIPNSSHLVLHSTVNDTLGEAGSRRLCPIQIMHFFPRATVEGRLECSSVLRI